MSEGEEDQGTSKWIFKYSGLPFLNLAPLQHFTECTDSSCISLISVLYKCTELYKR